MAKDGKEDQRSKSSHARRDDDQGPNHELCGRDNTRWKNVENLNPWVSWWINKRSKKKIKRNILKPSQLVRSGDKQRKVLSTWKLSITLIWFVMIPSLKTMCILEKVQCAWFQQWASQEGNRMWRRACRQCKSYVVKNNTTWKPELNPWRSRI